MATHNAFTSAAAAPTQSAQTQDDGNFRRQQPAATLNPVSFGLANQLGRFGTGGDTFDKIFKLFGDTMKKITETATDGGQWKVIRLLTTDSGLNYSAIIVIRILGGVCAAHTLMIEKTGTYPRSYTENINNVPYTFVLTPAEAMDENYAQKVRIAVSAATSVPPADVQLVDSVLVPNEFNADTEESVYGLLSNSLNALGAETEFRVNDYRGCNLQQLIADNPRGKFYVSIAFNADEASYLDAVGMPIRQDVCVTLSFRNNTAANRRSVNQMGENTIISQTYGYIDFEYTQPRPMNGVMGTQKFVSNFIITGIESPTYALTPDLMMMGVASVASLNQDMSWTQAFRPTPARKNEIDLNDIGALNLEGNISLDPSGYGRRYDTKSKNFQPAELVTFLTAMCFPDMMISIDLPKASPNTWATSIFQYMHFLNDPNAYARMAEFLSFVTNGRYVQPNVPMFHVATNKIHGGFYRAKDGYRDLRHLSSYLAVANWVADTSQSPSILTEYTNTLYATTMPAELRACVRRKMIDDMSGNTAVYKQMYDRLTFNTDSLRAWIGALNASGCQPLFDSTSGGNDMFVRRATADFGSAMLGQDIRFAGNANVGYGSYGAYQQGYVRSW
ncbi:MAG: hypothetical protein PHN51_10420 [Candidatus Nanopelagicales bacterium]|nr:hypothetical protein [Candidatus Nanopelagicales bacterium]